MSCAENAQFLDPVIPSVESVSAASDSQPLTVALSARPVVTPDVTTPVIVTSWVSVRSTSVNVTVPVAESGVSESCVPKSSTIAAAWVLLVMTGVSLVPVIVIVNKTSVNSLFSAKLLSTRAL